MWLTEVRVQMFESNTKQECNMSDRSPIYNSGRSSRVISGPNGTWIAQHATGVRGSKTTDYWEDAYRPQQSKEEAMALVHIGVQNAIRVD